MIFVKPAEGVDVRRPRPPYNHIPAAGAWVSPSEHGFYWSRRVRQGDVTDATEEQLALEEAAAKKHAAEKNAQEAQAEADALAAQARAADAAASEAAARAQTAEAATHTAQVQQ